MTLADSRWFAVRSLYRSPSSDSNLKYSYEERIVLFLDTSFENALAKAELEAQSYVRGSTATPLAYFSAFEIYAEQFATGTELYSLIRDSDLVDDEYVKSFFDTGTERAGDVAD